MQDNKRSLFLVAEQRSDYESCFAITKNPGSIDLQAAWHLKRKLFRKGHCDYVSNFVIPGHALHEKGLQRQIGVGTLVSSQEQIGLLVALINRR